MAGKTFIEDGFGKGVRAFVSKRGELAVAPLDFDVTSSNNMAVINTAYNFYAPMQNMRFVITAILLYADKNVGATDASVQIYEASSASSTTVLNTILDFEMLKNTNRDITGLNLLVSEGVWINGKTNDNNVYGTIMGYYVTA